MSESPLKVSLEQEGKLLRLTLARPKANLIDNAMVAALRGALREHLGSSRLRGILLAAEGSHFSFGSSVEEAMPDVCREGLQQLHALILELVESPVPVLVAVRGQCLGGGLEVVLAANFIFAAPGAMFGQPEIKLALFAPAASALLPERIGQSQAEDLLLTGRSITAAEALRIGLLRAVADDPEQAALDYFEQYFAPVSSSSLRLATQAARGAAAQRVRARLAVTEELYLSDLMATHDAVEGLTAFMGKRSAMWLDR